MYADTILDFKDADGGYADGKLAIPYIMLNGGSSHEGLLNLWDLDGAGSLEMQNMIDVDGGYPLNTDDLRKDYWSSAFSYMIDGGVAGSNEFVTNSIHIKVTDNQIESNIRISDLQGNSLVLNDDGLYIKQSWMAWTELEDFSDEVVDTFDYFKESANSMGEVVSIYSDIFLTIDKKIDNTLNEYLNGMRKFVSFMDNDSFEKSLNNYTDEAAQRLYEEFYLYSPFSWENF